MKKVAIAISSLLLVSFLAGCHKQNKKIIGVDDEFLITLDKDNQIDGGDILKEGIFFHFDENAVKEHPSDSFIEIGAYGSIYLENYIQGLTQVKVIARNTPDYSGEFCLGTSSTPNSVEKFSLYSSTSSFVGLNNDQPYFSIHNRADNVLIIEKVEISGKVTKEDLEPLRKKIQVHDKIIRYDPNSEIDPFLGLEIDPKDIPENRVVKKVGENNNYRIPGRYSYGYEVYSKTKDGSVGKMLYSSVAEIAVQGGLNNNHLAVFHLSDDDVAIINVANHQKVDVSENPSILTYNWNSPVNDFVTPFYADRHYYPAYSVIGMPANKDGDGCYPVTTTYTSLEKSFVLPEPTMMDGYKFAGWYMDHDLTIPFDPDGTYVGDMTLYAKCVETDKEFRKVYYRDYDGRFLNKVDLLYEDESITLPKFNDIHSSLSGDLMYEVRIDNNRIAMLRPNHSYSKTGTYNGDSLTYDMVKDYKGDIHLYVTKIEFYDEGPAEFSRLFLDTEENTVISGYKMREQYEDGDFILPGRYIRLNKTTWNYDFDIYSDVNRGDEFVITDEVNGYIIEQGSYNSISTYGYGNKNYLHAKPLKGILRHDSVLKVNRRAFFNRYGLEGTYFPKNVREIDVEGYANTFFNEIILLPKNLQTIGQRAFMGSKNIKYVALPKSLSSVGKGAFSLGTYDEETYSFKNINYRSSYNEQIVFYYEGSEEEFLRLDNETREEIENNALQIVYNFAYNPHYGR